MFHFISFPLNAHNITVALLYLHDRLSLQQLIYIIPPVYDVYMVCIVVAFSVRMFVWKLSFHQRFLKTKYSWILNIGINVGYESCIAY